MRRQVAAGLLLAILVVPGWRWAWTYALYSAAEKGSVPGMRCAIYAGAMVNGCCVKNSRRETALYAAIRSTHTQAVALLLAQGADMQAPFSASRNALEAALANGTPEIFDLIYHTNPLQGDRAAPYARLALRSEWPSKEVLLHEAIELGRVPMVKYLLAHGADPSARTVSGVPLIQVARINHRDDIVRLLEAAMHHPAHTAR